MTNQTASPVNLEDITIVIGVDAEHLVELTLAWPTWMQFKPELRLMPLLIFYDAQEVSPDDFAFMRDHPNISFKAWEMPHARSQREKMLSGFVHIPANEVQSNWFLKLDTDLLATGHGEWIDPSWFSPASDGRPTVIVAAKWGYSKPRYVLDLLDDWGDARPLLKSYPRLEMPYDSHSDKVSHPRITSCLFFGLTSWTREMSCLLDSTLRLPYPSHDTFMFYCAARTRAHMVRINLAECQWAHRKLSSVKQAARDCQMPPSIETSCSP